MRTLFYDAFGGRRVLFARLYDAQLLDVSRRRRLRCVLHELSGGEGEWSAPRAAGRAFVSNASHVSRCRFAAGTQLREYPYMAQSLERQLATLRACFERLRLYEATRGLTFAYVLRTRTDTAFLLPSRPHCALRASTVWLGRAHAKGGELHHMFADHAAVVPRAHAESFFVGSVTMLRECISAGRAMPPAFSEPEAFIHHALVSLGASTASAAWYAAGKAAR